MKYYYYHIISWPHLSHVAVNESGRIIGYCLGKLDDDEDGEKEGNLHGHITSISVLRSYRRMGIASMLLRATHEAMLECYQAKFCALHVRERNRAALALYENTLHYQLHLVEEGYYGDGENALELRLPLSREKNLTFPDEFDDFPTQKKVTLNLKNHFSTNHQSTTININAYHIISVHSYTIYHLPYFIPFV